MSNLCGPAILWLCGAMFVGLIGILVGFLWGTEYGTSRERLRHVLEHRVKE